MTGLNINKVYFYLYKYIEILFINIKMDYPQVVDERVLKYKKILQTDKELRSKQELEFLLEEFIKLDYIKNTYEKFGELITVSLLKSMYWKEYRKGDIIYKQGDTSKYCYFLIRGLCEFCHPEQASKAIIKNLLKPSVRRESLQGAGKQNLITEFILTEGNLFGEKEITERRERQYTVRCAKECIVGEISKLDYLHIFENTKRLEINEEMRFLNSVQVLKSCPGRIVQKIHSILEKKVCRKGEIVAKQDYNCESIYIVRKGSFEMIYNLKTNYKSDFNLDFYQSLDDNRTQRFTSSRIFELKDSIVKTEPFKVS
jgi:CRP-like cAMP-binding protein